MYIKQRQWCDTDTEAFETAKTENLKMLEGIVSYNKSIKGSASFCQQLGSAIIFFTLSVADYRWPDLFKTIAPNRTFESLTEKDREELMHANPLITSFHFQQRVKLFIKYVIKPIFEVSDVYYRCEWQNRCSTHTHSVLWIHDAPSFNEFDHTAQFEPKIYQK